MVGHNDVAKSFTLNGIEDIAHVAKHLKCQYIQLELTAKLELSMENASQLIPCAHIFV